jgi:diguanylate cyclase (GGDEF)-like protein/PAS domain S-box-containing protein
MEYVERVFQNIPVAIGRVTREHTLYYANDQLCAFAHKTVQAMLGLPLEKALSPEVNQILSPLFQAAFHDGQIHKRAATQLFGTSLEVTVIPEPQENGTTDCLTFFFSNPFADAQKVAAQQELEEHITALNAHAIVATTDAYGVILSINKKFCEISQYPEEMLIGYTHRVVNSGYHPSTFFRDLWETIASGTIWHGEICNRRRDGSLYWVSTTIVPFLNEDRVPVRYLSIRHDITQLKELEREAKHLALYDSLTNLPNRRLWLEHLDRNLVVSERTREWSALLYLDLDHFKDVNDTLGHSEGDRYLCEIARRLQANIRRSDTVARMGGDEFIVILSNLGTDLKQATYSTNQLGEKLLEAISQPYQVTLAVAERNVVSSASMGALLFRGTKHNSETLLQQVDLALYSAKALGRNRLAFFDEQLQVAAKKRVRFEKALSKALEAKQLRLYYQPLVNQEQRIVGLEALIRWFHPKWGMVSPADFIPLAEESGLIIPIGEWVLDTVIAQLAAWKTSEPEQSWTISVNISARQLTDTAFHTRLMDKLHQAGVNPERICLEVTETSLMTNIDEVLINRLQFLREQGVYLSLDDFGTGYSSLSYLRQLPFSEMKIDKSFVDEFMTNTTTRRIIIAIFALAKSLDLDVVAEGIESDEQYAKLKEYGCQFFQGYLFGRPQPIEELKGNQHA